MSAGRQGSIAGYFTRTPVRATTTTTTTPATIKDEVIAVNVELSGPSRKRRKLSPELDTNESNGSSIVARQDTKSGPGRERIKLDSSNPFLYPPSNHVSYHPPPSLDHNHPLSISPPPQRLLDSLSFSQSPRPILKPALNLDLLYFDQFIAPPGSRMLYDYLLDSLPWYRVKYTVRGININTPRWTTVFGKDSSTKSWTGYDVKPRAIPEILLRLMEIGT